MPEHPHWQGLLKWLATHNADTSEAILVHPKGTPGAGYGLFAVKNIQPSTRLFCIPPSALLNVTTLSKLYPMEPRLTAVQLISLHLMIYRPQSMQLSTDPHFGPYISTLPSTFESHPLFWICSKKIPNSGSVLLPSLPPNVMKALCSVADRFKADCVAVRNYLEVARFTSPIFHATKNIVGSFKSDILRCEEDYLWAWLNVNTRCIYHALEHPPSGQNNITLCPLLDFANHTAGPNTIQPKPSNTNCGSRLAPQTPFTIAASGFTIMSPSSTAVKENCEVFLTYGAHPNRLLFVEYGFVNHVSHGISRYQEVDLQKEIEGIFQTRGLAGQWMKEVLADEGYWGDWTLHLQPSPAHPSFRTITALRLLALLPASEATPPTTKEEVLAGWKATIMGTTTRISQENEDAWRASLLRICKEVANKAAAAISESTTATFSPEWTKVPWIPWMRENILLLWEEELCVANAVVESLCNHEEF